MSKETYIYGKRRGRKWPVYRDSQLLRQDLCAELQRHIGCLKMQVSVCKRASNYRALLHNMTYEDRASYGSSTPCMLNVYDGCMCLDIHVWC